MRKPSPANCPVCFGIGWVCENHSNRAWDEEIGCQCGAGMPCQCIRADGLKPRVAAWHLLRFAEEARAEASLIAPGPEHDLLLPKAIKAEAFASASELLAKA